MQPIIIIGGGFAALQTIKMLRKIDTQIAIELFTSDNGAEYNKPSLSHVFSQNQSVEDLTLNTAAAVAEQYNIVVHTHTRVESINAEVQYIEANGKRHHYSKLVLATGASTFVPPVKGLDHNKVLTLNSLSEFHQSKPRIDAAKRIAIIGGGLIGVELALDLQVAGKEVTVFEPASHLLANLLPTFVSDELERELIKCGVRVKTNTAIIEAKHNDDNVVLRTCSSGLEVTNHLMASANRTEEDEIVFDEIIAAAGLRPNIELAIQAGIDVNQGIVVDSTLSSSVRNIFAIGDCAEIEGRVMAYLQPAILSANVLAKQLTSSEGNLALPPMLTKVKTPSYPIQLSGKHIQTATRWEAEFTQNGIVAKAFNDANSFVGFVVTGNHPKAAFPLLRELQLA
ncbi:NADH:flavorubredoxin reductase NorW [Vibrio sp. 99-70-13A1]|uniref:NADH:flavorubredoxin reductase NorW n=1 Tax=Vibrio sp. 99-70-13A1 TaxID=2607601 RepID=UPI001493D4C7|nr:NADH:flavorubredoxin reductase NorW [Vibrio sp. 99-70-13A1]NOH95995.1 NADH:flavorubredoxin reductase NorW [Vibrio sp. 99-70-13A1]